MKLTVKQLRQIINEEVPLLREADAEMTLPELEDYVHEIVNNFIDPILERLDALEVGTQKARLHHQGDPDHRKQS